MQFGIVDTPEYRRMNPNRLIPTLEDDGFVLWESNAIVRYLAAKRPEAGLWPADPQSRADADRWMDWQATTATPAMRDAFWHLIRTAPAERSEAAIRTSAEKTEQVMAILDEHLADRSNLTGDAFRVGDIAVGASVHRWLNLPLERQGRPNVEAWYARLRERPGAQQVLSLPVT
jgi:glutathione S-transferase